MYSTDNVETYNDQVLDQLKQHSIPSCLRKLQRVIQEAGFITECSKTLEKIDQQVTTIRLSVEKALVKLPLVYKTIDVAKVQVNRICLLERLKRKNSNARPYNQEISRLQEMEFGEEVTPDNLNYILTEERQHLRQLQANIDVPYKEHLQNMYIKAHDDGKNI